MKIKNIFKCLVAVIAVFTYSCSGSDDGDGGTTPGTGGGSGITSITVTASENSIELGGSVTFTVTANDGSNVTTSSTILVNNTSIQGVSFTPTATGSYVVRATNGSLSSANINVEVIPPVITALRIESPDASIKVGDTADFVVIGTDASGNDYTITDDATLSINGTQIEGSRYMATVMGDLVATATNGGVTSTAFTLPVTEEVAPGTFQRTVAVMDATGTWCQFCPRVSYGIELVEAATDKAFIIAAHVGDNMQNTASSALIAQINPGGTYPTAVLNGTIDWTFPEPNNVAQVTNLASGTTSRGLSVNSMVVGNNLQVYVSAAFAESLPNAKLVVYVLESGIDANQVNGTSYYGGVNPLNEASGFTHNHTLRSSLTAVLGDAIPAGNTGAGQKYTQVFDIPIPTNIDDPSEISVVAMIVGNNFEIVASNGGHTGEDKDFN
ncbi:Omp28-related outer membrane protein [Kordia sp. YSTF-M3]|uniref:Omp28-related outer membrane protein n=1 Tax=Kordia aestuariivivens TaxID=2759037 RepID=A0ABR7Q4H0_9FLAO|nr:Omp28-related outer membrane protein [Kordia aestuariivivens]MBC8753451.1 Omp28-related outer membrane protein [Kordia aestuariivivens]